MMFWVMISMMVLNDKPKQSEIHFQLSYFCYCPDHHLDHHPLHVPQLVPMSSKRASVAQPRLSSSSHQVSVGMIVIVVNVTKNSCCHHCHCHHHHYLDDRHPYHQGEEDMSSTDDEGAEEEGRFVKNILGCKRLQYLQYLQYLHG